MSLLVVIWLLSTPGGHLYSSPCGPSITSSQYRLSRALHGQQQAPPRCESPTFRISLTSAHRLKTLILKENPDNLPFATECDLLKEVISDHNQKSHLHLKGRRLRKGQDQCRLFLEFCLPHTLYCTNKDRLS